MLVVPVYNMILTPDAAVIFQMEQLKRSAGGREISVNERVILIVAKIVTGIRQARRRAQARKRARARAKQRAAREKAMRRQQRA